MKFTGDEMELVLIHEFNKLAVDESDKAVKVIEGLKRGNGYRKY